MSAPKVNFRDLHPWGKISKKDNVAGEGKPYDSLPESAWVACKWCGMRNNTAKNDRCRQCDSDTYYF